MNVVLIRETTEDPVQSVTQSETSFGFVDFESMQVATTSVVSNKRWSYQKYLDKLRYDIGKYASQCGATAAARKFNKIYPKLRETTVRDVK